MYYGGRMDTQLALKHDLSPIENANLSPRTKAQYIKAVRNYLNTGARLGDADALSKYALGLHKSSKSFLKASIHLLSKGLVHELKAGATPNNLLEVQSALYRLESLQDAITVEASKGEKVHTWLSQAQVKAIMATCDNGIQGKRDWIILGLLLGSGLRCLELVNLRFDNLIDLPMPKNGIRTCLQVLGKGDKIRTIPIKPLLATRIQEWKAITGDGKIARSLGRKMILGDRLASQAVFQIVRKHGALIGLPEIDPHDLRRTFAQIGFEAGVPITQISKQLGHSNITTTQRYLNMDLDLITTVSDFIPLE
jgi:integrase